MGDSKNAGIRRANSHSWREKRESGAIPEFPNPSTKAGDAGCCRLLHLSNALISGSLGNFSSESRFKSLARVAEGPSLSGRVFPPAEENLSVMLVHFPPPLPPAHKSFLVVIAGMEIQNSYRQSPPPSLPLSLPPLRSAAPHIFEPPGKK